MEERDINCMEKAVIYISNKERNVEIYVGSNCFSYIGPKNLIGFKNIVDNRNNVLYVDTYFKDECDRIYVEEDYIDLNDVFEGYDELLSSPYEVVISNRN